MVIWLYKYTCLKNHKIIFKFFLKGSSDAKFTLHVVWTRVCQKCVCTLGLCDMDKKYISRFFDFFFDFDFNHDFDTNRHALSYTSCFCTSYLSCTSCFALFFILLHILLFISFFYLYICSCVVLLLYNFYSLHCPLSGPDLIYNSLLIIPCIIYHVTNKETLTFTVINAFWWSAHAHR